MEILEMIEEWRKGCSLSGNNPVECTACTETLINSIEAKERLVIYSGCITPKFHLVIDRLRAKVSNKEDVGNLTTVDKADLSALMHEFFRLSKQLHRANQTHFSDEEHRVS